MPEKPNPSWRKNASEDGEARRRIGSQNHPGGCILRIGGRFDLAWAKEFLQTRRLFVVILAMGLFAMAARPVTDPDVWWHLRTGQLILETHKLIGSDPYSFTRSGQPWVDHEWLTQILMFGLYRLAGWGALVTAFSAVIAAALFLVFVRSPGHPYIAGVVTLWGAFASIPSWGVRPQMLTFLFASVLLLILELSDKHPHLLWCLPPLMLLWVNLHAGYATGIALLALFLVGDMLDASVGFDSWSIVRARLKMRATILGLCLAVIPLNPYGWSMYRYPFETLQSRAMQSYIGEWLSPDFHQGKYAPALLLVLATLVLPALSPRQLRPREILLLLTVTFAAFRSVRHIPIYILVTVPIVAALTEAWFGQNSLAKRWAAAATLTQPKLVVNAVLLAGFLAFTVARLTYVTGRQPETERTSFPEEAAEFLLAQPTLGPVLNHYNWGGYFIWKLYPHYAVYIDGRADVYGDSFMDDFASTYYLQGSSWRGPLLRWGIRTIVMPPDAPLIVALRATPEWKAVYAGPQAVILTRAQ